jgi:peptidoglycan/xylan/chitin deacetylase (PgdA/CDA1 family)
MQRLAAEGHEIGYHSADHGLLDELRQWKSSHWIEDYELWLEGMRSLLGEEGFEQSIRPYARAPYGLFNASFLKMTEEKGLVPVSWSVDTGDQVSRVRFRHGDIFMLHVSTIEARILDEALSRQEIRFGPLSEFLPDSTPGLVLKRIPSE